MENALSSLIKSRKNLGNQKGNIILWLLGILSVSGIVGIGFMGKSNFLSSSYEKRGLHQTVSLAIQQLTTVIDSDESWEQSLIKNSSLACLQTPGASCCSLANQDLKIYTQDGNLFYDGSQNTTQGFGWDGEICSLSDSNCPVKLSVTWSADPNAGSTCSRPIIRISTTIMGDATKIPFRSNQYDLNYIRGGGLHTLAGNCIAINGVFNPSKQRCYLKSSLRQISGLSKTACEAAPYYGVFNSYTNSTCYVPDTDGCPQGSFLKGINPDGSKKCSSVTSKQVLSCPPGQAIKSLTVGPDASRICVPYPIMSIGGTSCSQGGYHVDPRNPKYCYADVQPYFGKPPAGSNSANLVWNYTTKKYDIVPGCGTGQTLYNGSCIYINLTHCDNSRITPLKVSQQDPYATSVQASWNGSSYICQSLGCASGYTLGYSGTCEQIAPVGGGY